MFQEKIDVLPYSTEKSSGQRDRRRRRRGRCKKEKDGDGEALKKFDTEIVGFIFSKLKERKSPGFHFTSRLSYRPNLLFLARRRSFECLGFVRFSFVCLFGPIHVHHYAKLTYVFIDSFDMYISRASQHICPYTVYRIVVSIRHPSSRRKILKNFFREEISRKG